MNSESKTNSLPPSWRALAIFGRLNILPTSMLVASIAVILARIYDHSFSNAGEFLHFLSTILDAPVSDLPLNLQRTFWVSLCTSLAQLLFALFCPNIIKGYIDFDEWKAQSDDSAEFQQKFEHEYGRQSHEKLPERLHKKYLESFSESNYQHLFTRLCITAFLVLAVYLTARIILDQLFIVAGATNWLKMFV